MIPILYSTLEDALQTTPNNGLGRLTDCISCVCSEQSDGIYQCEFQYPVTGIHYDEIQKGCAVLVTHDYTGDRQAFKIYHISRPINGVCSYIALHASYELSNIIVEPLTATSVSDAFAQFEADTTMQNPFTFWTDNVSAGNFESLVPSSIRALLGGQQGSILDVYGGEYEFDGYIVKNHAARGTDSGVTIRYGKNLTDITDTTDDMDTYNAVVPYWSDGQETVVYGGLVTQSGATNIKAVALDLSGDYEDAPTVAQLETAAASHLSSKQPWIQKQNIKIDFIALWQTEEYKNVALLERVGLCDTVHVIHPELGVNVTAKVIKVTWNVLTDRYDSMELGEARSNFAETILGSAEKQLSTTLKGYARTSAMTEAINHATELITGGLGGHIVFLYDANGYPTDMLVMDTDDISTAVNVLRINVNGIGFSNSGYLGPFDSAWTLDGAFVADFITAGHLSCNRIQGGTLSLGGADNGNGVLRVYDQYGNEIGSWTKDGLTATGALAMHQEFRDSQWSNYRVFDMYLDKFTRYKFPLPTTGTDTETDCGLVVKEKDQYGTTRQMLISDTEIYREGYIRIRSSESSGTHQTEVETSGTMFQINAQSHLRGYMDTLFRIQNDYSANKSYFYIWCDEAYYKNSEIAVVSSSSKRYKHAIASDLDDGLDPKRLYDLKVKQFIYNEGHPLQYEDMEGQTLPGFIAEDVAEIYPAAVIRKDGEIESWDERRIIPGMLALIQEQKKQLDAQEKRIKALEKKFDLLMEALEEDG